MTLDVAKPGGSKNLRNGPTSADTPPHWADFYQLPVENDIIAGTEWVYGLWAVLHRTATPSYCASGALDKTARELCALLTQSGAGDTSILFKLIITAHIRTNTFHAIYDILECQGYLQSVCPALIDDILQEIKASESDNVTFSVDLRRRCKIAGPILEHKMSTLQKVLIKQHRNLNLKNHARFLNCLFRGMLTLAFVFALSVFALTFVGIAPDSRFLDFLSLILPFCPGLVMMTSSASSYACSIVSQVDTMNTDVFKLIWAVRDMTGLLALIAESDRFPLTDASRASRFIKAFRASFLEGGWVLLGLRWFLQELPDWRDKDFAAHYWDDCEHANADDGSDAPHASQPTA
ncbi:hypothetical protein ARMSODRAFT_797614 [Armillaria solidipes]|uniref:Uncharacterized protein n=1 Tax=Armillaria solidipes TaxID=1076256 RepID=A0A2H3BM85_9AGAR|nr:hypothetical protein ARMSODRAFT_797614 [Armillaria solidipes]